MLKKYGHAFFRPPDTWAHPFSDGREGVHAFSTIHENKGFLDIFLSTLPGTPFFMCPMVEKRIFSPSFDEPVTVDGSGKHPRWPVPYDINGDPDELSFLPIMAEFRLTSFTCRFPPSRLF